MKRVIVVSGNTRRPSKTRMLAEVVAASIQASAEVDLKLFDLVDAGPGLGAFARDELPRSAIDILDSVETADALIVGSPVYKGSYAGLLKHLFDFVDPLCLAGKPVLLLATGGGERHALVGEHQMRPLFGFFSALTIPTYVYASDSDFRDGSLQSSAVLKRAEQAAGEMAAFLTQPALPQPPKVAPQLLVMRQG